MAFGQPEIDPIFDNEFEAVDEPYKTNLRNIFKDFANGVNDEMTVAGIEESVRIAEVTQEIQGYAKHVEGAFLTAQPVLQSATVDGVTVVMTYEEPIQDDPLPPASIFTFDIDGSDTAVASVDSVVGAVLTLTLASAATAGQTVVLETYDYTDPDAIQNAKGTKWQPVLPLALTNNT